MPEFTAKTRIEAPAGEVAAWHAREGARGRLTPPWEPAARVEAFGDHSVEVVPEGPEASLLIDRVAFKERYRGSGIDRAEARLDRLFRYRHAAARGDIERHHASPKKGLLVAVTGSSGFLGVPLVSFLKAGGHRVVRLVRADPGPEDIVWDPEGKGVDPAGLEGADAVVNLAGENIASKRWTETQKARIRDSRVLGTRALVDALSRVKRRPAVLVSASAIGYYGDSEREVDEGSPPGKGFLADVCVKWEEAAAPAAKAGIRVVLARIGMVLSPAGGALAKMLTPFKLCVGGPVGGGEQPMRWVSVDDFLGAVHFAITRESVSGAMNVTAPGPTTNAEFARVLGRVLGRPAVAPMPAALVRLVFGEMGDALLLGGASARPDRLESAGFRFLHPDLEAALRHVLGIR